MYYLVLFIFDGIPLMDRGRYAFQSAAVEDLKELSTKIFFAVIVTKPRLVQHNCCDDWRA